MSKSDDNYIGMLLEEIRDQNKAVLEAVGGIRQKVDNQPIRSEFNELRDDVKTIKAAVTDQSKELKDHEQRLTYLETRAA